MTSHRPALRVGAFGLLLAGVLGVATAIGALGDPVERAEDPGAVHGGHGTDAEAAGAAAIGGLAAVEDGYRLVLLQADLAAGAPGPLAFEVLDRSGDVVTDYELRHERRLHLVVARDDLSTEVHVHPELGADGVWRTTLTPASAGRWRAIADFVPEGEDQPLALAVDVLVPGPSTIEPLPPASRPVEVDGYRVELEGQGQVGDAQALRFTVSRAGAPVRDLQTHLGARGHLVVLRAGDLGYLHVHPEDGDDASGEVAFLATFPTAGSYRLHLEFRHADEVRTAAFTLEVPA